MNKNNKDIFLKVSPNLKIIDKDNIVSLKNVRNKNSVTFEGKDVLKLLGVFQDTYSYNAFLEEIISGDAIENEQLIKQFINWEFLIPDLQLEYRECPICGSISNLEKVSVYDKKYDVKFRYVQCDECNLVYLNPSPSSNLIDYFYSNENYYSQYLRFGQKQYEKKLILESNTKREEILKKSFNLNTKFSLLDIGCGTGDFLKHISKKYKSFLLGADKDANAINYLHKTSDIETILGDFKNIDFREKKFDIITMWGYLEHDPLPKETLAKCSKLLRLGGLIIFEIPNIDSRKKKIETWPYLHPPFHLSHFGIESLSFLANKVNLEIKKIITKRTGSFILKYSEFILRLIYKYCLFYQSRKIDYLLYIISKPIIIIENIFGLYQSKIIVILGKGTKNEKNI